MDRLNEAFRELEPYTVIQPLKEGSRKPEIGDKSLGFVAGRFCVHHRWSFAPEKQRQAPSSHQIGIILTNLIIRLVQVVFQAEKYCYAFSLPFPLKYGHFQTLSV
jgi:hypothetical protein